MSMSERISGVLYVGSGLIPDITLSNTTGINTSFNTNKANIDFAVYGTGNGSLYFDASTGRLGVGTGLPDAILHVVAPCAKDGLIVESVTNCPTGVTLLLVHNPQTPPQTGSYPAIINLAGRDTNYQEIYYGQIMSKILDPVTGFTSGEMIFTVDDKGVNKPVFQASLFNTILGGNSTGSGFNYTLIGSNIKATGHNLISIGVQNTGLYTSGIVVGNYNRVNGAQTLALVNLSNVIGANNTTIGELLYVSGTQNTVVGRNVDVSGSSNILLGNNNDLVSSATVGLTQLSSISGLSGIVLGVGATNAGHNNIYIGNATTISGSNNSLIGSFVSLTGNTNIVHGNNENIIGSKLICVGSDQNIINVNSGLIIGNNVNLLDSYNTILVGMGNNTREGLEESIIIGINNNLASGTPTKLLLVGQNNVTRDIITSLIVGNANNASGSITNSCIIGDTNAVPPTSNNNLVLGVLNNQTGVYVDSVGSISGTPRRTTGSINNSISAGINNVIYGGNTDTIVGNKNAISGSNVNIIGSYNNVKNASNSYGIGNSNFLIGDRIGTVGSKTTVIGRESVVFNTADKKVDVFGSGNIVIGYNQVVSSGIAIGTSNRLDGVNNIVYGRNNALGSTRNQFYTTDNTGANIIIPSIGILNKYIEGDQILVCLQNPPSLANTFVREISNVVENTIDNTTTITVTIPMAIDSSNGFYSINNTFDDNNQPITTVSGLVMPYQSQGGAGGVETDPVYGSHNTIIGNNNSYLFSSGVIIGNNNTISGVKNLVLGYNITGIADHTVYIGSSNDNKIILNDSALIINSGQAQNNFIVKSSNNNVSIINATLNNNRVGINTDSPTSALSVSGLITTSGFRMGFAAPDQYVLATDINGVGSWQLPVRISGADGGLLYRVNDKVASGLNNVIYTPSTNQINFNLGGNNGFYITSSGLFVNDDASNYRFRIRGSGGVDFARTLFDTNFSQNRLDIFNIAGNSGNFSGLTVSNFVNLPTGLTGTYLFVNNSGRLSTAVTPANSILFANEGLSTTGNTSLRWVNSQRVMAMGATGIVSYDSLSTSTFDALYNIILSSNPQIDTTFNNLGLGGRFSVLRSGTSPAATRAGFHILPTGSVAVNAELNDALSRNTNGVALYVNGRSWSRSLRIGDGAGSVASGLYLRTDGDGNLIPSLLDIKTQMSGYSSDDVGFPSYPINVYSTPQGGSNFLVDISFTKRKSDGTDLSTLDDGTYVVWDGDSWNSSRFLKAYQSTRTANDLQTSKGIEFGYKSLCTRTNHNHTYAAGSFKPTDDFYDGSSQYARYYLRTRTTDGSQIRPLVTNWSKDSINVVETSNNCINLGNFSDFTNTEYDRVWTYRIEASVLWQAGSTQTPNPNATRNGGGFVIEGSLIRTASGIKFTKLGTETLRYYGEAMPNGMGMGTAINTTDSPRLTIQASGAVGYTALWSATAFVTQINHPGGATLY